MHTTTKFIAAAATAAVLVGASACTSGKPKASADITGAQSTSPSPSASASPSPTQSVGAPEITLPADYSVDVQFKPGGDAVKDKVAADLSYALRAFNEAEATGDINRPGMLFAYTGFAGGYMNQAVSQLNSRGQTVTGSTRYYALTIEVKDPKTVAAAYCEDQAKAYAKDRASGQVRTTTPSINDYTDWTMGLTLSDKGVWQVSSAQAEKGSTRCQSAA
ncbi:hypothetical protein ACFY00_25150 [Kitasatospora sp. NPDC001540]|uniref:hypothetical protein n=1 Tax=Kitasatospora sp. NPDC001540 TaxID=3364014 RepID=UPI0036B3EF29